MDFWASLGERRDREALTTARADQDHWPPSARFGTISEAVVLKYFYNRRIMCPSIDVKGGRGWNDRRSRDHLLLSV